MDLLLLLRIETRNIWCQSTNGKVKWKDVPIVVHLMNGNVINFNIEASKTDDHFKGLPVFGTVESIIGQDGKELLKR